MALMMVPGANSKIADAEHRGDHGGCAGKFHVSRSLHGCYGLGGDAFTAAGKAQAFGGGGLHADTARIDVQDFGNLGFMASRYGPILGRSQIMVTST